MGLPVLYPAAHAATRAWEIHLNALPGCPSSSHSTGHPGAKKTPESLQDPGVLIVVEITHRGLN